MKKIISGEYRSDIESQIDKVIEENIEECNNGRMVVIIEIIDSRL